MKILDCTEFATDYTNMTTNPEYWSPNWDDIPVNDWRNYISEEMRKHWRSFTTEQRRMIYENAQKMGLV